MTVAISFWEFGRHGEDAEVYQKIFNDRSSAFRWLFFSYVVPRTKSDDTVICIFNGNVTVEQCTTDKPLLEWDELVSRQNWEEYVKAYFEFANNEDMRAGYDVVETSPEGTGTLLDKLEEADGVIVDDIFFWNFSLNLEDDEMTLELPMLDDDMVFSMEELINANYIEFDKKWTVNTSTGEYYIRPVKINEF